MSRIKSDSPLYAASKAFSHADTVEGIEVIAERFSDLAHARQFVPAIVATGVFAYYGDLGMQIIEKLAALRPGAYNLGAIDAERERLMKSADAETARRELDNLCTTSFVSGAEAGYLLGIAVGQSLGPDALKGGAK